MLRKLRKICFNLRYEVITQYDRDTKTKISVNRHICIFTMAAPSIKIDKVNSNNIQTMIDISCLSEKTQTQFMKYMKQHIFLYLLNRTGAFKFLGCKRTINNN